MTYADIIATFGNPGGDFGSGIHTCYYNVDDGTSVWIVYEDNLCAQGMSNSNASSSQLLHTTI